MTPSTILVVEDNPASLRMLTLALEADGHVVVQAADARAALAAAERTLPDLVLQDLILPDMDGLELVQRLRRLVGGAELPILALSGFLGRLEEARTIDAGFTALLSTCQGTPTRPSAAMGCWLKVRHSCRNHSRRSSSPATSGRCSTTGETSHAESASRRPERIRGNSRRIRSNVRQPRLPTVSDAPTAAGLRRQSDTA